MLDEGPLSSASRQNQIIVPLATAQRKTPSSVCLESDCHHINGFLVSHDSSQIGGTACSYTPQTTELEIILATTPAIR